MRGAVAAVAVPAALAGLLSLRLHPFPAAQPEVTFVFMPSGACGLYGASAQRPSLTAMSAAKAAGDEPKKKYRPPVEEIQYVQKLPAETPEAALTRVEKKTIWLKSLKGKFVPRGPKPWDEHRFTKVCIQVKLNAKTATNTKIMNQVTEEMRRISGMHPRVVKAKANLNVYGWREGMPCGVAVTLRGKLMTDFMTRLNMVILPRVRDFEGLYPNSFDNDGNYWMGFENQEPFRELDDMIDDRVLTHGFYVGIINNCFTQMDGLALMKNFGFPFGDPHPPRPLKPVDKMGTYVAIKNKKVAKQDRR